MILELLLLLVLLFVITLGDARTNNSSATLRRLQHYGEAILDHAQVEPRPYFQLAATATHARTEQHRNIYLVLTRPDGTWYDDTTLVGVLCHELAHIVSGAGDEHGANFEMWESDLLRAAQELGWYDDRSGITPEYPCFRES